MSDKFIDLHVHSVFSDGYKSVSELVNLAKSNNVKIFAISDHDDLRSYEILKPLAKKHGLSIISAVELSTYYICPTDNKPKKVHLLGYGIDVNNEELLKQMQIYKNKRFKANIEMLNTILQKGIDVPDCVFDEVKFENYLSIASEIKRVLVKNNYDYDFVKKFLIDSANFPSAIDYWGTNLPILRYTDVKMMYAEALNEIDYAANKTTIFSILNEVRTRGGLKPISEVELPDYNTVFDCIVHERFVEFAFEGLRWPDLVRWRLAEEKIAEHFALQDEGYDESTETPMYGMKKYHHLAPIPYIDIVAYNNENILWQNEGY